MRNPLNATASELRANYILNMHRKPTAMQYGNFFIIHNTDDTSQYRGYNITNSHHMICMNAMIPISSFCFISSGLVFTHSFHISRIESTEQISLWGHLMNYLHSQIQYSQSQFSFCFVFFRLFVHFFGRLSINLLVASLLKAIKYIMNVSPFDFHLFAQLILSETNINCYRLKAFTARLKLLNLSHTNTHTYVDSCTIKQIDSIWRDAKLYLYKTEQQMWGRVFLNK